MYKKIFIHFAPPPSLEECLGTPLEASISNGPLPSRLNFSKNIPHPHTSLIVRHVHFFWLRTRQFYIKYALADRNPSYIFWRPPLFIT